MDANSPWLIWILLLVFLVSAVVSTLFCFIAMGIFPKFRSGEHKPGTHRSDLPIGNREIKTIELPLVGGPAFTLALVLTGIGVGYLLHLSADQWTLLLIALGATVGYMLVGFVDDWRKVYCSEGISEIAKFSATFLVGALAAALYFFLLPKSGQVSYSLWKDLPGLNTFLCPSPIKGTTDVCSVVGNPVSYYGWLIFLMLLTGLVGTFTSVSVDFSDGLDGLAGGLVFSASLGMGVVVAGLVGMQPNGVVLEVLALLGAGAALGYLPFNWPSAWAARRGNARRRAKIYMGDSGALGLGGLLAMIAIFSRNETLLLMIGGAFVLEGLSALISARVLTRFFRRYLTVLRFENIDKFIPHTEFPLPFLATPLHHHFDLLGWDRRRLVYAAWALGACFAALGVMVSLVPFSWERYVGRFLIILLAVFIWSSGSWSKKYFVGKQTVDPSRRHRLALYYGYPYRIMRIRLYHLVEVIEASEDVIETPAEELALWQRMTIFDARAMLGLYCYRAGYYPAALAQWTRIPERNRVLRPEITHLLTEVDTRMALEEQITQPIRRSDIQRIKRELILEGNLQPADLPNPHEPVRTEETKNGPSKVWTAGTHSYPIESDDEEQLLDRLQEEQGVDTGSLHNGNGHHQIQHGNHNEIIVRDLRETEPDLRISNARDKWLDRLLHHDDEKE
jgi:UDP-N-acetylmuramyl pentapeptide phosphotransferase/UDP-N-acetylglucosamine-1-phosphate transferase